jgi:probable HAF family extracellular repeat protein
MKPKTSIAPAATWLLVALAVPALLAAQPSGYDVVDLGTLGGTFGWANAIDDKGSAAGFSTLPSDQSTHAFLWQRGVMTDLGTLGGPNSITSFSPFSDRGEIGGAAETPVPDPNGEDACFFGTQLTCRPVVWHDGTITELPTLGGNNGAANQVNNRGQVAGTAENSVLLPPCLQGLALPVIWENSGIVQLPLFPGDQAGVALAINDKGRAVGFTATCTGGHALIWEDGTATNLGSLGGTFASAAAINNQDQVVGSSNLAGDTTFHAFLWQDGVMTDLGTLPDHSLSAAFGINSKGQIVGQSCSDGEVDCRAFLWQDGVMTDLNDLIPADSPLFLFEPVSINSRGQIAGAALDTITLETRAFLATPTSDGAGGAAVTKTPTSRSTASLPENIPKQLNRGARNRPQVRAFPN